MLSIVTQPERANVVFHQCVGDTSKATNRERANVVFSSMCCTRNVLLLFGQKSHYYLFL
jgi:hypothetical protein